MWCRVGPFPGDRYHAAPCSVTSPPKNDARFLDDVHFSTLQPKKMLQGLTTTLAFVFKSRFLRKFAVWLQDARCTTFVAQQRHRLEATHELRHSAGPERCLRDACMHA